MKQWKEKLASAVVAEAAENKNVSFRKVANAAGYLHINRQDTGEIMRAVLKRLDNYRAVRMEGGKHGSLFTELCFIENSVEFDSGEEFLDAAQD